MKIIKRILIVIIASFLVGVTTMVFAASKDMWPNQEGEVCLNLCGTPDCTGSYDPLGVMSLYVMKMGKGHYLVLGRNVDKDYFKVPFIGAAEIDGPKVRLHVTVSLPSNDPSDLFTGQMIRGTLDPKTLVGTVEGINIAAGVPNSDPPDNGRVFSFGVLYIKPCP